MNLTGFGEAGEKIKNSPTPGYQILYWAGDNIVFTKGLAALCGRDIKPDYRKKIHEILKHIKQLNDEAKEYYKAKPFGDHTNGLEMYHYLVKLIDECSKNHSKSYY